MYVLAVTPGSEPPYLPPGIQLQISLRYERYAYGVAY